MVPILFIPRWLGEEGGFTQEGNSTTSWFFFTILIPRVEKVFLNPPWSKPYLIWTVELFPTHLSLCRGDDAGNSSTSLLLSSSPYTSGHTRVEEFRGFLAMAATCVVFHPPTHTHNAGLPQNKTKGARCVTHLLIMIRCHDSGALYP